MKTYSCRVLIFLLQIYITKGDEFIDELETESPDDANRIVGGENAGITPYQVSLRNNAGYHMCGASIISNHYILTAAHCVKGTGIVYAVVGTNLLSSEGTRYDFERIIPHSGFSSKSLENDIALIKTSSPIIYTEFVQPIGLTRVNISDGMQLVSTGWGQTSFGGPVPDKLQTFVTRIISRASCAEAWSPISILTSQICTFTKIDQGLCHGDSGGPLVNDGYQHAIVSFGRPCARGVPDVCTRVSAFVNWIRSKAV